MSYSAIDWAYAQGSKHDLDTTTVCVLAYLCRRMEEDTGHAWPSNALIAEACRTSDRTVSRTLRVLRDKGLIVGDRRGSRGRGAGLKKYHIPGALEAETNPQPVAGLNTQPVADRRVRLKGQGESTSYFHAGSEAPPSKRTVGSKRKARQGGHPDDDIDPANAEDLRDVPAPLPPGACPVTFERTATRTGSKALCEHFGLLVLGRKYDTVESKPLASVIKNLQETLDNEVIHGMIHAFAESDRDRDLAQWRLFAARKSDLHQKVTRQVKAATPATAEDYAAYDEWSNREQPWQRIAREAREASTAEAEVCKTPATHHEEN